MRKYILHSIVMILMTVSSYGANEYRGQVVDDHHRPILYATVYMQDNPVDGTATNPQGEFTITTELDSQSIVVISFIGYEKITMPLRDLTPLNCNCISHQITLHEQPIALEETVIKAKKTKMSKRKKLAIILHEVYSRTHDLSSTYPTQYQVVSDVRMDAGNSPWGMEQMIAKVVESPVTINGQEHDSIQFTGQYCKRFCDASVRTKIDSVIIHESDVKMRKMANQIDSGTVVHRALWRMRLDQDHLLDVSDELSRWKMSMEGDHQLVLTYTRKYNYLGILKATIIENLIVDDTDFTLQAYTADMQASLFLPFSIKLKGTQLEWLNLLNMTNESIEKFRLKRGNIHVQLSTIYEVKLDRLVAKEKNLQANGQIEDRSGRILPIHCKASQNVTDIKTENIHLDAHYNKRHHVRREIVEIY